VPEWYLAELAQLFAHIGRPLALLFPELPRDELDLMVRALFSSVHGIVLLGLEKRISGVPRPQIEHMLGQVLSQIGK
jgi:signal-transduction protein with cAMP-binding, CBS, and nucleotidyltransferase domain